LRFLLDTHLLLWAAIQPKRLSSRAAATISDRDNNPVVSAASLWEIAIKFALRQPDFDADPHVLRRGALDQGYEELPVRAEHAVAVLDLPRIHRDPFDRLLIAQAIVEGIILLTADATVARYPGPIRMV